MRAVGEPEIIVARERMASAELARLVRSVFKDMVKFVVDISQERLAIGGDMHADAEALLLETGSRQQDLWGANYYPGRGPDECIEYTSLINIRPSMDNRVMEILIEPARSRVREIALRLIGRGEAI